LGAFFQGLSDPTRVRILELLAERPHTVTELVEALGLAQGRVSSHLSCLRWCGYVEARVEGRYNRYRLVDERVREILRLGEAIVRDNAERLTSCLVLATEAAAGSSDEP
jgi:DNA-binding transcriptional ArsR family regulator